MTTHADSLADAPVATLAQLRDGQLRVHRECYVCAQHGGPGLGVQFDLDEEGGVGARVEPPVQWQSYGDRVHGGVIATLIDGAMTNCLFARGVQAVTADLRIRYRRPVRVAEPFIVTARLTRWTPPLFEVEAAVTQGGELAARATAKFFAMR